MSTIRKTDAIGRLISALESGRAQGAITLRPDNVDLAEIAGTLDSSSAWIAAARRARKAATRQSTASAVDQTLEAAATRAKLQYQLYSENHPASLESARLIRKLTNDPNVKVRIYKDRPGQANDAFALPTGEIFVSRMLLRRLKTEEASLALLGAHEATHVKEEHGKQGFIKAYLSGTMTDFLEAFALRRKHEQEADLHMLIDLDAAGVNPTGAFEFFDVLSDIEREEERESERKRVSEELPIEDLPKIPDAEHGGSAETRKIRLQEILRFLDLPNLEKPLTPIDWNALLDAPDPQAAQIAIADCSPTEFWTRLASVSADSKSVKRNIALFVGRHASSLSSGARNSLVTILVQGIWQRSKFEIVSPIAAGLTEIFEKQGFESVGIFLFDEELRALARAFREPANAGDTKTIKKLRSLILQYRKRHHGASHLFEFDLDTQLLVAYLKNKTKGCTIPDLKRFLIGSKTGPVNVGEIAKVLLKARCRLFDLSVDMTEQSSATTLKLWRAGVRVEPTPILSQFSRDFATPLSYLLSNWNPERMESARYPAIERSELDLKSVQYFFDLTVLAPAYILDGDYHEETYKAWDHAYTQFDPAIKNAADRGNKNLMRDPIRLQQLLGEFTEAVSDPVERSKRVKSFAWGMVLKDVAWNVQNLPDEQREIRYALAAGSPHDWSASPIHDNPTLPKVKRALSTLDTVLVLKKELGFLESDWKIEPRHQARLSHCRTWGTLFKGDFLERLSRMNGREILATAPQLLREWAAVWVTIDPPKYEKRWKVISSKVINYLKTNPAFPQSSADHEELLNLALLAQGNFEAVESASALFLEMVRRSPDFASAFDVFQRYDYLPMPVTEDAFDALQKKATHPDELDQLSNYALSQLTLPESARDLLLFETIGWILQYVPAGDRLALSRRLITTDRSDLRLKSFLIEKWYQHCETDASRDLAEAAKPAWFGERKNDPAQIQDAVGHLQAKHPLWSKADFKSFPASYQAVYGLSTPLKYAYLRQLTLEGEKPVLELEKSRIRFGTTLISHYLGVSPDRLKSDRVWSSAFTAVAHRTLPSHLFYYLGPLLSKLALQTPKEAMSDDEAAGHLYQSVIQPEFEKWYPGFSNLSVTPRVLEARTKTLVTGINPAASYDAESKALSIEWPPARAYRTIENFLLRERLAKPVNGKRIFEGAITPVDLAVEIGKSYQLANRWNQLGGLYGEFSSEKEREKIFLSFDRTNVQNPILFWHTLNRHAKRNDKLNTLVHQIASVDGILGGGAEMTTYGVTGTDGRKWAVGVQNPNAGYSTRQLYDFVKPMAQSLASSLPDVPGAQLVAALLDDSYAWVEAERQEKGFFQKAERFAREHDGCSSSRLFVPPEGSTWTIKVPELLDTGVDEVRWEERIEGSTLARLKVAPDDSKTDLSKNLVSSGDAEEIASLISLNFLCQFLRTGNVHSNIHPGNFMITHDKEIAILDRKLLIELTPDQINRNKEFFGSLGAALAIKLDPWPSLSNFLDSIIPGLSHRDARLDRLKELAFDPTNRSVAMALARSLTYLKHNAVPIPLPWLLIAQDLLGCIRICKWAGGEGKRDFSLADVLRTHTAYLSTLLQPLR